MVYGQSRRLAVVSYEAVWPRVLSLRPIQVLVVRDPEGRMRDCYLFTTDLRARAEWVVTQFAWRWAIDITHAHYTSSERWCGDPDSGYNPCVGVA
jgi:hypothetical protein